MTERLNPFGIVRDHEHAVRRCGDDLFPQQCTAAALDEIEIGIDFVGAVDGQIEPVDIIERGQGNAATVCVGPGRFRCRYADDIEPGADPLAQQFDKMLRGRTGAKAEFHAIPHEFERTPRRLPFQFVHIHA